MELSWRQDAQDGVTLVELELRNDAATEAAVRVENRLDGPVLYPRRQEQPAPGWDANGFEGVLAAGETRALGYACEAPPAEPPVELAGGVGDAESGTGTRDGTGARSGERESAEILRAFGDPRPPVGAASARATDGGAATSERPADGATGDDAAGTPGEATGTGRQSSRSPGHPTGRTAGGPGASSEWSRSEQSGEDAASGGATDARAGRVPPAVAAWLDAVEAELDREPSSRACGHPAAAGRSGGLDRAALEAVAARVDALREQGGRP